MNKTKKMSLEELTEKYNESVVETDKSQIEITDKRYSRILTPRRVRDYVSKGLLDKPIKEGRNSYYTESHLEKLKWIREMQSSGLSEQSLHKYDDYKLSAFKVKEESPLKEKAEDVIRSLLERSGSKKEPEFITPQFGSSKTSYLNKKEIWEEYPLTEGVVVKVKANEKFNEIELLEEFRKLLKEIKK